MFEIHIRGIQAKEAPKNAQLIEIPYSQIFGFLDKSALPFFIKEFIKKEIQNYIFEIDAKIFIFSAHIYLKIKKEV